MNKTRLFRNKQCKVVKVTKNTQTGAIYDHVEIQRSVTNRRTNEVTIETLTRKMRRNGTGVAASLPREVEIEADEVPV